MTDQIQHDPAAQLSLTTADEDDTRAVGAALAGVLTTGDVVLLSGDLGAGKTRIVQGAAAALGVEQPVTSPTFVLVKLLAGRVPVVHVDVYRLEQLRDVEDLGEDVFAPDVVTFVEWGDRLAGALPHDRLELELTALDGHAPLGEDGAQPRRLIVRAVGGRWQRDREALHEALAPWAATGDAGAGDDPREVR